MWLDRSHISRSVTIDFQTGVFLKFRKMLNLQGAFQRNDFCVTNIYGSERIEKYYASYFMSF